MSLLTLVLTIIAVGVLMWLVNKYIPMAEPYKSIMNAIVIIAVVIWILRITGVLAYMGNVQVPHA